MSSWANINSATCHLIERKVEWVDMKKLFDEFRTSATPYFSLWPKNLWQIYQNVLAPKICASFSMSSGGRLSRISSRINRTDCKVPCKVHDGRDQEFQHSPNRNPTCYGDQPRHKDNQCDLHCGLDAEDIQQKKDFTAQGVGLNLLEASVWILKDTSDEWTLFALQLLVMECCFVLLHVCYY